LVAAVVSKATKSLDQSRALVVVLDLADDPHSAPAEEPHRTVLAANPGREIEIGRRHLGQLTR